MKSATTIQIPGEGEERVIVTGPAAAPPALTIAEDVALRGLIPRRYRRGVRELLGARQDRRESAEAAAVAALRDFARGDPEGAMDRLWPHGQRWHSLLGGASPALQVGISRRRR